MDSLDSEVGPAVDEDLSMNGEPEVEGEPGTEGALLGPVRRRWVERARALVLGPHGGGTTRRRASDAVRLGTAVVVVALCIPLARANTELEQHLMTLVAPAPTGVHWLFTLFWVLGSFGVIAGLVLLGLFVPRLVAVRHMLIAGVVT